MSEVLCRLNPDLPICAVAVTSTKAEPTVTRNPPREPQPPREPLPRPPTETDDDSDDQDDDDDPRGRPTRTSTSSESSATTSSTSSVATTISSSLSSVSSSTTSSPSSSRMVVTTRSSSRSALALSSSSASRSSASAQANAAKSSSEQSGSSTGAVAGIVVGVLIALLILLGGIWFFVRARKRRLAREDRDSFSWARDDGNGGFPSAGRGDRPPSEIDETSPIEKYENTSLVGAPIWIDGAQGMATAPQPAPTLPFVLPPTSVSEHQQRVFSGLEFPPNSPVAPMSMQQRARPLGQPASTIPYAPAHFSQQTSCIPFEQTTAGNSYLTPIHNVSIPDVPRSAHSSAPSAPAQQQGIGDRLSYDFLGAMVEIGDEHRNVRNSSGLKRADTQRAPGALPYD